MYYIYWASLMAQMVKESACNGWGTQVQSRGQEDPLAKEMATHSSILTWQIPWTGAWQSPVHGVAKSWT